MMELSSDLLVEVYRRILRIYRRSTKHSTTYPMLMNVPGLKIDQGGGTSSGRRRSSEE